MHVAPAASHVLSPAAAPLQNGAASAGLSIMWYAAASLRRCVRTDARGGPAGRRAVEKHECRAVLACSPALTPTVGAARSRRRYTQDAAPSVVQFTQGTGSPNLAANGSSTQYLADHGFHHSVTLADLPAGARIIYRCGDGTGSWSPSYEARAPLPVGAGFNMSIFGDMGYLGSKVHPCTLPKGWRTLPLLVSRAAHAPLPPRLQAVPSDTCCVRGRNARW